MREQLLGYLLNALDSCERLEVERALASSAVVRAELELLRRHILKLELANEIYEPPAGLTERTCDVIFLNNWLPESGESALESKAADADLLEDPALLEADEFARCWNLDSEDLAPDAVRPAEPFQSQWQSPDYSEISSANGPRRQAGRGRQAEQAGGAVARHWSIADFVVASGVFLAAALLFFPAIASSRIQSNIIGCQNNLLNVNNALMHYSDAHGGQGPSIPLEGKLAVAGYYGTVLLQNHYLDSASSLICPGSPWPSSREDLQTLTLDDVQQAEGETLASMHRSMSGNYAFPLGYVAEGEYRSPQNLDRPYYALAADAVILDAASQELRNHGARGVNVLFENGSIQLMVYSSSFGLPDHPFYNRNGEVAAGLDIDDSVLGRSETRPLKLQWISR